MGARELDWIGYLGQDVLADRFHVLLERSKRRPLTTSEHREVRQIERAQLELKALYRARLRCELEGIRAPLERVRIQATELSAVIADHPLRCLEPDDLLEIRQRWPEWDPAKDIASGSASRSESPDPTRARFRDEGPLRGPAVEGSRTQPAV